MNQVTPSIPLFLSKSGSVRIWNASHVIWLRNHRIVGSLIGVSAESLQEIGLPFELLPEQVSLLLDYGWAKLYFDPDTAPTDDQLHQHEEELQQNLMEYQALRRVRSDKIQQFKMNHPDELIPSELRSPIAIPMIMPTAAEYFSWNRQPVEYSKWDWPSSSFQVLKYKVFKHLFEMGYHISIGSKFGGEYLLYSGFHEDYHSNYIVSIVYPDEKISAKELIAVGRLGTAVKKTHVLCSWSEESGFIGVCLNWEGLA